MSPILRHLLLVVLYAGFTVGLQGQDIQSPVVKLTGDKIEIIGKYVKIAGYMPQKDDVWLYRVEHLKAHLFVYHFWAIGEFQDRKEPSGGFFRARSWNVQVLESKDDPEKKVIFDKENDFYFWGTLTTKGNQVEVRITSIEGLPPCSYGPVLLNKLN